MNLNEAQKLVDPLMTQHLSDRWKFKWDNAVSRFGSCDDTKKTLTLSKKLTELNDVEDVKDTILHEIAHALDYEERGYSNHDKNWIRIAKSIGCDGIRCYGNHITQPQRKWIVSCETCGGTKQRHRYSITACGKCCKEHNNGKFTKKFQLKYELNPNKV